MQADHFIINMINGFMFNDHDHKEGETRVENQQKCKQGLVSPKGRMNDSFSDYIERLFVI